MSKLNHVEVAQTMIDEALSKKYGWMTREEWRKTP